MNRRIEDMKMTTSKVKQFQERLAATTNWQSTNEKA
ncbi:MAG: hypothetical protein ACI9MF_001227 [Gammaproteobacteria bacterium]|jgi:hypothetical protein